jgi:hypothetical protein
VFIHVFFASFFLSVQAAMAGLEPLTLQVFYHHATVAGLRILQSIKNISNKTILWL